MTKALLAVLASIPLAGCVGDAPPESSSPFDLSAQTSTDIATARAATTQFHDLNAAIAAGYSNTGLPCIEGQGYHYINPNLLGTFDVTKPHLIMYVPRPDGTLQLDALEWIQPISGPDTQRPTLFGQVFGGPDHVDGVPFDFYGLHVWAWVDNPDGMFVDQNPIIHCP